MAEQRPTVVLVHGAFADSSSWNGVIEKLQAMSLDCVTVANPLRSLTGDAACVRDVIAGIGKPVVLVGHSYAGMVITEAAAGNDAVTALVDVSAFAPDHGEDAFGLSMRSPAAPWARPYARTRYRPAGTSLLSRRPCTTTSSAPICRRPRPP
jgi:pimeloyl-ACP methyl ester carboxylesterase